MALFFFTMVQDVITSSFRISVFADASQNVKKSRRYEDGPMDSAVYVSKFSLILIRDLIGNQCSDSSRG